VDRASTAYQASTAHRPLEGERPPRGGVLGPVVRSVLDVQDEVRAAFGWSLDADRASAEAACTMLDGDAPCGRPSWSPSARTHHLEALRYTVLEASAVVVVGAAASEHDVRSACRSGAVVVAADGAAGAVGLDLPLIAVVSDLDGAEHLERAVRRAPTLVLHAHGDNTERWQDRLHAWSADVHPLPLVLTHQTPSPLAGAENPGGFTDGDRAVCLLLALGVPAERLTLVGFATDHVGPWSGSTDPDRKRAKLRWMADVLQRLGMPLLNGDEH